MPAENARRNLRLEFKGQVSDRTPISFDSGAAIEQVNIRLVRRQELSVRRGVRVVEFEN